MTVGRLKAECGRCRHLYVTWDENFPRGCRALGFKSRELPSIVVLKSSGLECQLFEPRAPAGRGGKGPARQ